MRLEVNNSTPQLVEEVGDNPTQHLTGPDVRAAFVARLLEIFGDTRFLWLPSQGDGKTVTSKDRHGHTITWDGPVSSRLSRLGSGAAQSFNGVDQIGEASDDDALSFGDGNNDQPLSVLALVNPSANGSAETFLAKKTNTSQELWFAHSSTGKFKLSIGGGASRVGVISLDLLAAQTWQLIGGSYDRSKASAGIALYIDAVKVGTTEDDNGSYGGTPNTAIDLTIGHYVQGGTLVSEPFDGSMALLALVGKVLTPDEMWTVKELVNAYFGLSL